MPAHSRARSLASGAFASSRFETNLRADCFAHEDFGSAGNNVIAQFPNALITQAPIEPLRAGIESGNAEKNIRTVAKDSVFRELQQLCPNPAISPLRHNRQPPDVARERSLHVHNHDTRKEISRQRDVNFQHWIGEQFKHVGG